MRSPRAIHFLLQLLPPIGHLIGSLVQVLFAVHFDPLLLDLPGREIPADSLRFTFVYAPITFGVVYLWERRRTRAADAVFARPRASWTPDDERSALEALFAFPRWCLRVGVVTWLIGGAGIAAFAYGRGFVDGGDGLRLFFDIGVLGGSLANFAVYFLAEASARWAVGRLFPDLERLDVRSRARLPRKLFAILVPLGVLPGVLVAANAFEHGRRLVSSPAEAELFARLVAGNVFLVAVFFTLVLVVATWMHRMLVAPIERITALTERLARGEFEARTPVTSNDEIGVVASEMNAMAKGLAEREQVRDLFGRYVNDRLLEQLQSGDVLVEAGGEYREVAIVFTDVRRFSSIAERLGPAETMRLVNEYFAAMTEIILEREGTVLEYMGDGILAVFGAPISHPDDAERAVRACLAMRDRLVVLNRRLRETKRPELEVGMGVHFGEVIVGNLGSPRRLQYGIVGDPVNVTARIEGLTKERDADILLSEDVRSRIPADLVVEPLGETMVKGRTQPVRLFRLPRAPVLEPRT